MSEYLHRRQYGSYWSRSACKAERLVARSSVVSVGCDALPFPLSGAELDTSWHGRGSEVQSKKEKKGTHEIHLRRTPS